MGAVILIVAVVLIVLALVYYLVSVIFALQKIANGLDETIAAVGEIVEKTKPVAPVVDDINANLDAAVSALEGLLVKKAGMADAVGLVEGLSTGETSLVVLAIGAGSVFFSHVNDAGFWLVKEYFGLSVGQTIKSWSIMETVLSVSGLVFVLLLGLVI